jgi:peptide/nickel transport system permease protein
MTVASPPEIGPTRVEWEVLPPPGGRKARFLALLAALMRSGVFVCGSTILLFWIFDALFWPLFVPQDPQALNLLTTFQSPSAAHWLGTDDLGRDVFSRCLAGASIVLAVAPAATALGLFSGVVLGLLTGYYRGWIDEVVMRLLDAQLAFPLIIFGILVLVVLGPSVVNVILVIGFIFTPNVARTVRSVVIVERERDYVSAAKLLGNSDLYTMVCEILPNITGPISVEATIRLGYAIFTSATLSFLSLGIQQPSPDWGLSVSLGRAYIQVAPWMVLSPAAALATLVVAVNLLADGLHQVLAE